MLSAEEEGVVADTLKSPEEPSACSALQVDFMQAVSQQLTQAQVSYCVYFIKFVDFVINQLLR